MFQTTNQALLLLQVNVLAIENNWSVNWTPQPKD